MASPCCRFYCLEILILNALASFIAWTAVDSDSVGVTFIGMIILLKLTRGQHINVRIAFFCTSYVPFSILFSIKRLTYLFLTIGLF